MWFYFGSVTIKIMFNANLLILLKRKIPYGFCFDKELFQHHHEVVSAEPGLHVAALNPVHEPPLVMNDALNMLPTSLSVVCMGQAIIDNSQTWWFDI